MPECYIRGSTIKYLRIPDEVIDMVKEDVQMKSRGRGEIKGRGQNQRGRGAGRGNDTIFFRNNEASVYATYIYLAENRYLKSLK